MLPEVVHGDGRELGSGVVLSLVLVDLMNRNSSVDDGWLNSLLLHDGLNVLVYVVVDVLTRDSGVGGGGVLGIANGAGILKLGLLGGEALLHVVIVAVLDVAVLNASHVMRVLLGHHLLVLDGLDGGMVVILVNFTVNSRLDVLMLGASDVLVGDGRVDAL